MAWTTTTLLAHIRRVASLPSVTTAPGYTDADLLAHADTALQGAVLPLIANARDEHGVHFVDLTVPAGQQFVRLPPRVLAGRLRDITRASPLTSPTSFVSVTRLEPEDVAQWGLQVPRGPESVAVVLEAGFLRIVPVPTASMTLRISYIRTPPTLASVASCFSVTGITPGTPNVTFTHAGSTAGLLDIVLASNGDSLGDSTPVAVFALGSTQIAAANLSARFVNTTAETARYLLEGLFLCPAGTSCVVPLPDIASTLLAFRSAIAFMQSVGDTEGVDRASDAADRMTSQVVPIINERVEGEPQVVRPRFGQRTRSLWRW